MLFYPVPSTNPQVNFPTPFVSRVWDALESETETRLGTLTYGRTLYTGPLPPLGFVAPSGSADQWLNGCSYAVWLAGGYTKNCPSFTPPMGVTSCTSPDGSITVNPTTGDITIVLNMSHSNIWGTLQRFSPLNPSSVARIVAGLVGQTADLDQWTDSSAIVLARVDHAGTLKLNRGLVINSDHNPLQLSTNVQSLGTTTFGVENGGRLWTNQVVDSPPVGPVIGNLPLYGASGLLIGRTPVTLDPLAFDLIDTFIDTPSIVIPPHVPVTGSPWVTSNGSVSIPFSGYAHGGSSSINGIASDLVDANQAVSATFNLTGAATAGYVGVMLRWVDHLNYFALILDLSGGLGFACVIVVAGVGVLSAQVPWTPIPGPITLDVQVNGSVGNAAIHGGASFAFAAGSGPAGTSVGLLWELLAPAGLVAPCTLITGTKI